MAYGNRGRPTFALTRDNAYYAITEANSIFQILYDTNFSAVNEALQQQRWTDAHATYVPLKEFEKTTSPVEVLQACFYFEHQVRYFTGYSSSWAFSIIQRIKQGALERLPGHDHSKWQISVY